MNALWKSVLASLAAALFLVPSAPASNFLAGAVAGYPARWTAQGTTLADSVSVTDDANNVHTNLAFALGDAETITYTPDNPSDAGGKADVVISNAVFTTAYEYPGVEAVGGIDSQAAICVAQIDPDTTPSYYGWAGAFTVDGTTTNLTWLKLAGAAPPADGTPVTVTMSFDYTVASPTVTFKAGTQTLNASGTTAIPLHDTTKTQVTAVSFSGEGSLAEMTAESAPGTVVATFLDGDGSTITNLDVAVGATPVYPAGAKTPTKAATAQWTFTFDDWDPALAAISANQTYTPVFTSNLVSYTITWTQDDDTVIDTTTVEYGTVPTHADATKSATPEYTYTFASWTPQLVAVTGPATYKATYTSTKNSYTITWKNDDGTTIDTATVEYGVVPTHADATKAATDEYTYTFAGWDTQPVAVTGDATYTATFTSAKNSYTITWTQDDDTVIDTTTVEYGTVPTHADATKSATPEYTYTFASWTPQLVAVTGPATYKATYTAATRKYTVTFEDEDHTEISSAQYDYGTAAADIVKPADPTKAADAQYTYTFAGWDPEVSSVTGDQTYTATYTAQEIATPTLALLKPTIGSTVLANAQSGAVVRATIDPAAEVTGASSTTGVSVDVDGATATFTSLPWNEAVDWRLSAEGASAALPGRFYAKGEAEWFNVETNDLDDVTDLAEGMKGVDMSDDPSAAGQMVRIQTCLEIPEGAMEELPDSTGVGEARTGFAVAQLTGDTAPAFYAYTGDDAQGVNGWVKLSGVNPAANTTNDLLIVLDVEAATARYYVEGIALYKASASAGAPVYAIPMKAFGADEAKQINGIGFANADGVKAPVVAEYDVPFEAAIGDVPYATADAGVAAVAKDGTQTLALLTNGYAGTIALAVGESVKVDTAKGSFAEAAPVVTSAAGYEVVSSVSGDVTTYTVDPIVYAISYELDAGAWPTGYEPTNSYTVATPSFTLATPAKTDYDFVGWFGTGMDATNATVTIASGSVGDRAYTSIWQRAAVTLTVPAVAHATMAAVAGSESLAGTVDGSSTLFKVNPGTAVDVTFTAETGWHVASTGNKAITLQVSSGVMQNDYTLDVTGAAMEIDTYAVTFSWHEDSTTANYEYGTPVADIAIPRDPPSYVEDGKIYTFTGWSAELPATLTGPVTITAQYDSGVTAEAMVISIVDAETGATTTNYVATLADAFGANGAKDGDTVELLSDVTLDARVEPNLGADTTLTIDLGGHTITRTGTSGNGSVFDVRSGNVTITNGVIVCTQDDTAIAADGVYAITSRSGSNVTLADLAITVDSECGACAYPFSGSTMTIESGTYANITTTPYRYNTAITGMAVNQPNNATQNLIIKGGSFSQYDPQLGDDSGAMTDFTDDGFVAIDDGNGHWVVQPGYNVTFDANGGTPAPEAQRVAAGALVMAPATNPAKAGDDTVVYVFNAWQLNDADFDFAVAPTADITLVADYTATSLANAIWIGGASGDWADPANWDIGYVPTKSTVVTFTNDCSVGIYRDTDHCKALVANADVTLVRADQGEGYTGSVRLNFWGDNIDSWTKIGTAVSGTGTLGVTSVDLCNATLSSKLTIDADLSLAGDIMFTRDQSGDTSIAFTVNGATTFADGTRISAVAAGRNSAGANTTFKGAITIPASGNVTFYSDNWGQFTVSSEITLVHPESAGDAPTTLVLWQAESGFLYMDGSVATDDTDNFYVSETSANGKRTFQVLPKPTVIWVVEGQTPVTNKVDYGTATASIQPADPASYVANGTIYTFTGWSPAVAETVTADATYTAQFSSVAAKATVFTVADNGATTNVVGTYASLAEAVGAAPAGAVVQVLTDVALASTVVVDKDLTIDLNGNDIAATDARALWIKSGDVTLDGTGTVSANGEGLAETSSVIRVGDSAANAAVAKLTIGKGVTVSSAKSYGVTVFGKNSDGDASTTDIALDVYGTVAVTSTGEADAAISGNGSSGLSAVDVTIRDGAVVSATNQTGIYFPGAGTLSIEGGSITAPTAVYAKAGTVSVSGGTLTATGAKADYQYYGNGPKATGDALVLDNCGYPNGTEFTASITGGTFVSQNAQSVASYAYGADATTQEAREPLADFIPATVEVDGQTVPNPARFSDAESDGVPAGYALVLVEGSDPEMYAVSAQAPIQWFNSWSVANIFYFDDEDPIPSRTTQGTVPTIKRVGDASYHAAEDWVQIDWTVTDSSATDASTPDDTIATVDDSGLVTFSQPGTVKVWLTMTDPSGATKSASKTVKYAPAPAYVVSADGNTRTAYATLLAAFNHAQTGETVVLGADATVGNIGKMELKDGRSITLDLNGHTVTFNANYGTKVGSLFNIQSGSLSVVDSGATKGGIAATGTGGRVFSMETAANATTALSIGEGVNVSSAHEVCVYLQGAATLTTAGNLTAAESFAIAGNGLAGNGGTVINVTGGTVAGDEVAIYHPQDGTLTISGGEITGDTAVYVKSGSVSVTGGTLTGTGAAADYAFNGNGANATGDALVIESCGYPGGAPAASITGGTFVSAHAQSVASYAKDENYTAPDNFIPGTSTAKFSDADADGVAEGYTLSPVEGSSNPVLYEVVPAYTILWVAEGVTLQTDVVATNTTPVYTNEVPTKPGHEFLAWSPVPAPAVSNTTYTATWTVNQYDVIWVADGKQFESNRVDYGTAMPVPATNPTKDGDDDALYTFVAWTPAQDATVTSNATYTAEFKTWTKIAVPTAVANLVYTGSEQTGVAAGTGYTLSGNAVGTDAGDYTAMASLADAENTVWADATEVNAAATAAKTIDWSIAKAPLSNLAVALQGWIENETPNTPAVSGNAGGGAETITYWSQDGETQLSGQPTAAGTYTVRVSVPETANYLAGEATAIFTIDERGVWTVIWLADDGTEIDRTQVTDGNLPTHADATKSDATGKYAYTFTGWSPAIVAATQATNYTATFSTAIATPLALPLANHAVDATVNGLAATVAIAPTGTIAGVTYTAAPAAAWSDATTSFSFEGLDWNAVTNWTVDAAQGADALAETAHNEGVFYAKASTELFTAKADEFEEFSDMGVAGVGYASEVASAAGEAVRVHTTIDVPDGGLSAEPDVGDAKAGFAVLQLTGDAKPAFYAYNGTTWTKLFGVEPKAGDADYLAVYDFAAAEPAVRYYIDGVPLYAEGEGGAKVYAIPLVGMTSLSTVAFGSAEMVKDDVVAVQDVSYVAAVGETPYTNIVDALAAVAAADKAEANGVKLSLLKANLDPGETTVALAAGEAVTVDATSGSFAGDAPFVAAAAPAYKVVSTGTAPVLTYKVELDLATVIWLAEDGTTEVWRTNAVIGTVPVYEGPDQAKDATDAALYTFSGWTNAAGVAYAPTDAFPAVAVGGTNYVATFKAWTKVARPTVATGLEYTGEEQTGVTVAAGSTATGVTAATNAGDYTATVALDSADSVWADATDPAAAAARETITANWSIARKAVTVTADNKSKIAGNADPALTATVAGLVNGESEDLISYTVSRVTGETAGTYEITASGSAEQGNYNVTFAPGTFTISGAEAMVISVADAETGATSTNYVATLADAFGPNGAQDGDIVELLGDVTLDARILVQNSVTIDLGGHTITRTAAPAGDNGSAFRVDGNYDVTIKNGAIDCSGVDDSTVAKDGVYAIDVKNGGDLTLADLDITVDSRNGACVYPWAGSTVTIESGNYANLTDEPYDYHKNAAGEKDWVGMAVNQANNQSGSLITISGGTFSKVNPMLGDDSAAEGAMTFVDADFFALAEGGVFTVVPRIDIAGADVTVATDLVYDGTGKAGVTAVSVNGTNLVAVAEVPVDASGYTVAYAANTNAGVNTATATLTGVGLWTGTAYATFSIAQKPLTVTADSDTKAYDGTPLAKSTYTAGALAEGDTFTTVTVEGTITDVGAVSNEVTAVAIANAAGADVTANYDITTVDGELKVTPAAIAIAIAGVDSTAVYTGAAQTTNVAWTATSESDGFDAAKVAYNGAATVSGTDAGSYAYDLDATKFVYDDANYTATFTLSADGAFTITPAAITITVAGYNGVYDGAAHPAEVETVPADATILWSVDGGEWTAETPSVKDVGSKEVRAKASKANYADATSEVVTLAVTKAPLSVAAKAFEITYGDAPANDGVTYAGFVGGEDESVLGGTLAYAYTYEQFGDVGTTYTITPSGLTSDNYDISYTAGALTVVAKEVGLTWSPDPAKFTYTGEAQTPAATATGLVNGDEVAVTVEGGQTNAGTGYTATATALTGAKAGNYKLPAAATTTFDIDKAAITITVAAVDQTAVYTGEAITKNVKLADAYTLSSDDTTFYDASKVTRDDTTVSGTDVGEYPYGLAVSQFDYSDANVAAEFVLAADGKFTITAATAQIPTAVAGLTYDGTEQTGVAEGTGYTIAGNKAVNAGDYTATLTLAANYKWSDDTTDATKTVAWSIAKKSATITVAAASKKHGEADPTFAGEVTGLVADGDLGTVTYVRTNTGVEDVGVYEGVLDASFTANDNYNVTVAKGTFTITANPFTIIWVVDGAETPVEVEWGETPSFSGTPSKTDDTGKYAYSFTGWTPEVVPVAAEATYTATFATTIATPLALAVADEKLASTGVLPEMKMAQVTADVFGALQDVELSASPDTARILRSANGQAMAQFGNLDWNQGVEWKMSATQTAEDDAKTAESAELPGKFYVKPEKAWFTAAASELVAVADTSDAAVGYTPAAASPEGEMVRVHTTVNVPAGGLPQAPETGDSKTGFAVLQLDGDTAPAFYAFGNGTWTKLAGVEPEQGEADFYAVYDLGAETPTARYYVNGVALYAAGEGGAKIYALPLASGTTSLKSISFASADMVAGDVEGEYDTSYVAAVDQTPYTEISDALEAAGKAGEKTLALLKAGVPLDPAVSLGSGEKLVVDYAKGTFTNETPVVSGVAGYDIKVTEVDTVKTYELDPIVYPIEYVLGGGDNAASNTNEYTVATLPVVLADATRTGYTFGGWTNNLSANAVVTSIPVGTTGAVTNVATWTINSYALTINYLYTNGTVAATQFSSNVVYDTAYAVDSPVIAGYTADKLLVSGKMGAAPVTVDVTYTVNRYTVAFVDEDGTVLKAATEYDYGTPADAIAKPETPTKAATAEKVYTFAGWTPTIETVTSNAVYKASYSEADTKAAVITVAQDGTTNTIYVATIADAIAAADDGDTIQLIGAVEGNATIERDVTIDLNGNTWTGDVSVAGDVTIVDGSDDADGKLDGTVAVAEGGSVDVAGGIVDDGITGAGDVKVSGGTVNGGITGSGEIAVSGGTVNGGITGSGEIAVSGGTVNGGIVAKGEGAKATIAGGTISDGVTVADGATGTISGEDTVVNGDLSGTEEALVVTGGHFEKDPSDNVADGYVAVAEAPSGFRVQKGKSVIGTTITVAGGAYTGSAYEIGTVVLGDYTLTADDYTVSYANVIDEATTNANDNVNAGMVIATIAGKGEWIDSTNVTFTITPVEVTVTASDKNVRRGTDPATLEFAVSYSGFVNNETKTVLTTEATADDAANASDETYSAASLTGATFPIVASGAAAANYTFKYVDGTLTVVAGAIAAVDGNEYDTIAEAVDAAGKTEDGKVITMLDAADAAVALVPGDVLKIELDGFDVDVAVADAYATRWSLVSDTVEGVTTYTLDEIKAKGLMITEFDFEEAYLVYNTGKAEDLAWDSDKAYCTVVTATDLKATRWNVVGGTSTLHSDLGANQDVKVENLDTSAPVRFFRIAVTPYVLSVDDTVEFAPPVEGGDEP